MEEEGNDNILIHLWCGPRTLSTASIYSFAQRPDTQVLDEPLYAYWLAQNPHLYRPYRDKLLQQSNLDGNVVLTDMGDVSNGKRIVVAKHMTKFIVGLDKKNYAVNQVGQRKVKHVFLLRDPMKMILSWGEKNHVHQEGCTLDATSLPHMVQLYSELRANGLNPLVVDSDLLAKNAQPVLTELCARLGIPFYEQQLSWPAGPKPDIDGIWAPYWYQRVHSTTGFGITAPSSTLFAMLLGSTTNSREEQTGANPYPILTSEQLAVYREALPFYEVLRRHALGMDPLNPGSSVNTLYWPASSVAKTAAASSSTTTSSSSSIVDHGLKYNLPASSSGTQRLSDPRNADLLVFIGDRLFPREHAKISVLDSSVQGGDAVWEGLRVYSNKIFKLEEHLQRLMDSAKAMAFVAIPSKEFIRQAIFRTLSSNNMRDGAHIRMTLTRGAKATYDNDKGITLITASNRRNGPGCVDSKIHHCNLINNILPKIQANHAGASDALMLDNEGFVSETNATNVFMVKDNQVYTPHADYCLPGITRHTVMYELIPQVMGRPVVERRISLAEFHAADEVFTTGTMGELTPVSKIDGRIIGCADTVGGGVGPVVKKLQIAYRELTVNEGVPLPF